MGLSGTPTTSYAANAHGTQEKDETDDHHTLLQSLQAPVPQLQEHRLQMPQQARRRNRTQARIMRRPTTREELLRGIGYLIYSGAGNLFTLFRIYRKPKGRRANR